MRKSIKNKLPKIMNLNIKGAEKKLKLISIVIIFLMLNKILRYQEIQVLSSFLNLTLIAMFSYFVFNKNSFKLLSALYIISGLLYLAWDGLIKTIGIPKSYDIKSIIFVYVFYYLALLLGLIISYFIDKSKKINIKESFALKIIYIVIPATVFAFILSIHISLNGNFASEFMARISAEKLIRTEYNEKHYRIDEVFYNFKSANYTVRLSTKKYDNANFSLHYGNFGNLIRNDYEIKVTENHNLFLKLEKSYSFLIKKIIENELKDTYISSSFANFDKGAFTYFKTLSKLKKERITYSDTIYKKYGEINITFNKAITKVDELAEILLKFREKMDDNETYFSKINISNYNNNRVLESINLFSFPYEKIEKSKIVENIKQNIKDQEEIEKKRRESKEKEIKNK